MTDANLRDHLDRLVEEEPALRLDLTTVVGEGRRLRRRRRLLVAAAGGATAAAVVTAVAVPLAMRPAERPDRLLLAKPVPVAAAPTGDALTPRQQRIADAIRKASPTGWTFELGPDRWDGAADVEGTADDGAGAGRLTVGLSTEAGAQQVHPCTDPEFKAGVGCHEQLLGNGSVLSVREVVDYRGIESTDVALTHPDGTGVIAESGNFVIPWPLPRFLTPEQKRQLPHISRQTPTYSPQELAKVVLAVDAATGDR